MIYHVHREAVICVSLCWRLWTARGIGMMVPLDVTGQSHRVVWLSDGTVTHIPSVVQASRNSLQKYEMKFWSNKVKCHFAFGARHRDLPVDVKKSASISEQKITFSYTLPWGDVDHTLKLNAGLLGPLLLCRLLRPVWHLAVLLAPCSFPVASASCTNHALGLGWPSASFCNIFFTLTNHKFSILWNLIFLTRYPYCPLCLLLKGKKKTICVTWCFLRVSHTFLCILANNHRYCLYFHFIDE